MNLVVGATGYLGSEICRLLLEAGKPVRALVRATSDPDTVARLKGWGAETVEGDLKDRRSLDAACRGIRTVISSATTTRSRQENDSIPTVDHEGQLQLAQAAKAAGVGHFIFVSFSKQLTADTPLSRAKRAVEESLLSSSMPYTILRPSYFMEVWLSPFVGFDFPNAKATVYGAGENRISWISLDDVAKFAAACVDNLQAHNLELELGGPEALSPLEVIGIFERLSGRTFEVQHVPAEVLKEQQQSATDPLQASFSGLMVDYAKGDAIDIQKTLQSFPVQLTSVKDYVQRVLGPIEA